jgi:TonB family protein
LIRKTGLVQHAAMYISTGQPHLDEDVLAALRQWRFEPDTLDGVRVPFSFLTGGLRSARYSTSEKSMDDVLARYLGKGTVVKGPIPQYPLFKRWTFKEGRGVYELHAGKTGTVESVKILKSSGDPAFDEAAQKTLGKWQLSHGPLVLELPLRYVLTPTSYKVELAR